MDPLVGSSRVWANSSKASGLDVRTDGGGYKCAWPAKRGRV